VAWAEWLVANGYSIDMGLTQVNSANLEEIAHHAIGAMFDPCANLAAGAGHPRPRVCRRSARRMGSGQDALRAALSAYNTGNHRAGLTNGYVAQGHRRGPYAGRACCPRHHHCGPPALSRDH
jgi:type IV secretion system protein VirB1